MKCPSCGHETQPGAKFCVQCGATLAAVSVAAAPSAPAPGATQQRPAVAVSPPTHSHAAPFEATAVLQRVGSSVSPAFTAKETPVLATPPASRLGLIAGAVAAAVVVGIAGYLGYRMIFVDEGADGARTDRPASAAQAPAQAEAAKESSSPPAATAAPPNNVADRSASPTGTAAIDQPKGRGEAVAPASAQAAVVPGSATAPSRAAGAAATAKTDAAQARGASVVAPTPAAASGATAKPATTTAAAATAQAGAQRAQSDRWEQMHQAMMRCGREEFLTRFVCEQRVGRQYCEGYWGIVPQCPGVQQRDRGQ